jgi:protein ImuA
MDALPTVISQLFAPPPSPKARSGSAGVASVPAHRHPPAPETLHPSLWLGHQLGRQTDQSVSSGFPALDAELPGGGWPRRVLSELLLPHPGVGEMRLLSPSLASVQQAGRLVMFFDPPQELCAWALSQMGLDIAQLLVIHTRCKVVAGSDSLWALEQALKSGHVGAVLAWLPPRLRAERMRRLQLAAHAHDGPAFVIRETAAQQRPTAAPLRLALRPGGADMLDVRVLKRRGPPLENPLRLQLPPVLSAAARLRAALPIDTSGARSTPSSELLQALQGATFINLAS